MILHKAVADIECMAGNKSARPNIAHALNELARHLKVHFETEVQMMAAFDFPDRQTHACVSYARLFEDSARLISDYRGETQPLDVKRLASLKSWLVRHIDENNSLAVFLI